MLRRNRIPDKNTDFSDYIYRTTAALLNGSPPAWQRLKLREDEKNKWVDFMNRWHDVYTKYTDVSLRTKSVTEEKNNLRKSFTKFAQPLLSTMSGSAATESDRLTFNLRKKERTYSKRGKIDESPEAFIKSIGGCRVKVRVRRQNQEGRSGKHPLADVLEMRYTLLDERVSTVALSACKQQHYTGKTYFIFPFPENTQGKWAYFYFRWVNIRNADNNGPFGNLCMAFIH